jgi:hypothetical protein
MVDALVSLVYNLGSLKKSSNLITDLNSGKYELAASRFLDYNKAKIRGVLTVVPGLTTRREREKNLFLSGGIPTELGGIEEFPLEPEPPRDIPLPPLPEFDTETETNRKLASRGFSDPKAKYPLYRNEPDTHRLARHAKISETVVFRKEISRDMDVPIAGTTKTWSQSPIPYNARYPNNKVQASESGHLFEFDDTDNSRRIHLYHAAGTFMEIDDNGTEVKRIVGDGYEIIDRNGFIHVKGALHVAVDGVHTLKVSGACNVDISGSTVINVFNDAKLNISGNMETSVAGDYRILVGGEYSVDASRIDLNSGKSSGLTKPKPKVTTEEIEFSELTVLTRGNESAMQYETPDESGDLTAYTNTRIETGEATKEDYSKPTEEKDKESVTGTMTNTYPTPDGIPAGCSEIDAMTSYPPHYQLSRHFTIGSFTQNGTRPIVAQMGLKPNQIACALKTLAGCLDLVKDMFPHMIITSGFRRPGDVANSSKTSKHYNGEAADVQLPGYSRKEYKEAVKKITQMFPFDQVILEYQGNTTWIHIGVSKSSQRGQIFTMNNHKRIGEMGELVVLA